MGCMHLAFILMLSNKICVITAFKAGANLLIVWYVMVMAIDYECDIELEQIWFLK